MDLNRARNIIQSLTPAEASALTVEIEDLFDSFDIDRNDPQQLDEWADRHMGYHDASSVDEAMTRKMAAWLRVRASEMRSLQGIRPEGD